MNLSVGVLYDCQRFIELCETKAFHLEEVRRAFEHRYEAAPIGTVLEMIRTANWIHFEDDGLLHLTNRGRQILECRDAVRALRLQLMDFIEIAKPTWSSLIPRGRRETLAFLPADARQCFNEAGLSNSYDEEVVAFWDRAANLSRGRTNDILLEIGREGERLSIAFETNRTGKVPQWAAIDSNAAGYDLLSVVSSDDPSPLKIEVKAIKRADDRAFFLTRNEWNCAIGYGRYVLHLWLLGECSTPFVRSPDELAEHVPTDNGVGTWLMVKMLVSDKGPLIAAGTYAQD
jgi:hypothetical protein